MASLVVEQQKFRNRIHQLFQQWRKDRFDAATLEWLFSAPFLQSTAQRWPATDPLLWNATTVAKLYLAWAVELLRPPVDAPVPAKQQRDFTIVTAYYRDGEAAKAVYAPLDGTESTFRTNWCKEATAAVADLLYAQWHATAETAIGQQWLHYAYIHYLPPGVQQVLQLLVVSTTPWSAAGLSELPRLAALRTTSTVAVAHPLQVAQASIATMIQQLPVAAALATFSELGWLPPIAAAGSSMATTPERMAVALTPALCAQLHQSLTPDELQQGHRLAAYSALLTNQPLTACWHWQQAGEAQYAANLLLHTGQALLAIDDAQEELPLAPDVLQNLALLLKNVVGAAVDVPMWGRLTWLRGRLAHWQASQPQGTTADPPATLLQQAMNDYQEALRCLTVRAEKAAVHYQLAALTLPLDSALADHHLRQCIELLTGAPTTTALRARAYIKRAWLSIQQRPDLVTAEANLKQARLLLDDLPTRDPQVWSDWYNAWGTLAFCKGEFSRGVEALAQGIDLLREQPNQVRLCMMLHNQGLEFSSQQRGEQRIALHYLQQSLAIAIRIQHHRLQMLCYKALGGCYFHQQQYADAIQFYERAYALIPADSDFKVHLCYDLAEAHVMAMNPEAAITYFRQGLALAHQMELAELIAAYQELATPSPWLRIEPYKPRMAAAIRLLQRQGQIKSQEYAQAANINEKTALKDLQAWVEQQILYQVGKARATVYRFRGEQETVGQ